MSNIGEMTDGCDLIRELSKEHHDTYILLRGHTYLSGAGEAVSCAESRNKWLPSCILPSPRGYVDITILANYTVGKKRSVRRISREPWEVGFEPQGFVGMIARLISLCPWPKATRAKRYVCAAPATVLSLE